jgi:hypothetical protein
MSTNTSKYLYKDIFLRRNAIVESMNINIDSEFNSENINSINIKSKYYNKYKKIDNKNS